MSESSFSMLRARPFQGVRVRGPVSAAGLVAGSFGLLFGVAVLAVLLGTEAASPARAFADP
ncbi:MAG: hypothetical protein L6Q76_17055, partial [Polyangiaceae bacterium]|nr:hypothetical protein [Polyangiaceae bacterium]